MSAGPALSADEGRQPAAAEMKEAFAEQLAQPLPPKLKVPPGQATHVASGGGGVAAQPAQPQLPSLSARAKMPPLPPPLEKPAAQEAA